MLCAADFRTYKMVICLLHHIIDMGWLCYEDGADVQVGINITSSKPMKQIKHWEILAAAANTK